MVAELVDLSWPELRLAGHVGIDRFVRARARQLAPAGGVERDDWHADVVGAWGEFVVAKTTGTYWADVGGPDRHAPDVGRYHVRTTQRADDRLILRAADPDDEPYVLVVPVRLPRFRIVGWCYGYEGKLDEYLEAPCGRPSAWFVPQHVLRPFELEVAS